MRIVRYTAHLDGDRKPVLVKEGSGNYPGIDALDSPRKIADMANAVYHADSLAEEYTWMLALDTKCRPVGVFEMSHGTVNASLASPREAFVRLCLCGAANFVLVHNHPSGDCTPSADDLKLTMRMANAGRLMNINLLDHIIVGKGYYSFDENGDIYREGKRP